MNVTKSVCISGNLQNGKITYDCYPPGEFGNCQWKLAVHSVSFASTDPLSTSCVISCNFVTSTKRSGGEVNVYEQPLNVFHLKTTTSSPRGVIRFCIAIQH